MIREAEHQDWRRHRMLEFRKTIYVSAWTDEVNERVLSYWEKRGFRFNSPRAEEQIGRRGSVWGNLSSFDMSRLSATLTVIRMGGTEITFVLEVDTYMQIITPWNRAYWQFELARAGDFVLYGDKREQEWREFEKNWRRAAFHWLLPWWMKAPELPNVE